MLIYRWQAELTPNLSQMMMMFEGEGLEPFKETLEPGVVIADRRHPFDEVRMVAQGEMLLEILGAKMLLREGDKVTIPANTRHTKKAEGSGPCVCVCSYSVG